MRQQCRAIVLEAIGQKQRDTAWRQHPGHLMHDALGHRQGAAAHIDHHQQLALGVHRRPHPGGGALQTLDGLVVTDLAGFELSQHRIQLIELQLLQVEITEKIGGKGAELLGRFDQPVQHRVGVDLKDPRRGTDTQALQPGRPKPARSAPRRPVCHGRSCRAFPENNPCTTCSGTDARGRHSDGRWRADCPAPASPGSHNRLCGQKCMEVSTSRGRRLVGGMGSGGTGGGALGDAVSCSHRAQ